MITGIAYFKGYNHNRGIINGLAIFRGETPTNYGTVSGQLKKLDCETCNLYGDYYHVDILYKHGAYYDGYYVANTKTSPSSAGLPEFKKRDTNIYFDYSYTSQHDQGALKTVGAYKIVGTDTYAFYDDQGEIIDLVDDIDYKTFFEMTTLEDGTQRGRNTLRAFYSPQESSYFVFSSGKKKPSPIYVWDMYISPAPWGGGPNAVISPYPSWGVTLTEGISNALTIYTSSPTLNSGTILYVDRALTIKYRDIGPVTVFFYNPNSFYVGEDMWTMIQAHYRSYNADRIFYATNKDQVPKDLINLDDNGAIIDIVATCNCQGAPVISFDEDLSRFFSYDANGNVSWKIPPRPR